MSMKYVNEITIEVADHEKLVVCNGLNTNSHVVMTTTFEDDERGKYHTTMTIFDIGRGKSACDVMVQDPEQSYFHEIFAPMYRSLCRKLGLNPKIVE